MSDEAAKALAKALVEKLLRVAVLRPLPEQLYGIASEALRKAADDEREACANVLAERRTGIMSMTMRRGEWDELYYAEQLIRARGKP